jgi:ubiquinone/menaquinone biosynthesis C-methylase UbiE
MDNKKRRVCPVERAGGLDTRLRALVQNPYTITAPFISPGATVLDYGCGPGFFTVPMAHLVGESGRVLAADLQQGMLDMVRYKIQGTLLDGRVSFHLVQGDGAGIDGPVDFVLLFYMVHEIEDKAAFFRRIVSLLTPRGCALMVEPPFHVSRKEFRETCALAEASGLAAKTGPRMLLSKSAVLTIKQT